MKGCLLLVICIIVISCAEASPFPRWVGSIPDSKINASAGLPVVSDVIRQVVYNATKEGDR